MALKELVGDGNGRIKWNRNGATCHREFIGLWGDPAPTVGTPHPVYSYLTVDSVECVPEGPAAASHPVGQTENVRMLVDYSFSYQRPKLGDPPRVNYETVSEALMTGQGRVWDDCGEVVEAEDFSTAVVYTALRLTVDVAETALPVEKLTALVNKVNDATWGGWDAGTVLLEDFAAQAEFDWDTQQWYFRAQYKFLHRDRLHNAVWRGPLPKRDDAGNILYYQNTDPEGANYDPSAAKAGHPIPKAGTAGVAGWATMTPPIYEEADFSIIPL